MKTRLIAISLVSMGLAACGALEDQTGPGWNDPTEATGTEILDPIAPVYPDVEKPYVGMSRLESCDIEALWWTSEAELRATPSYFEFTADGTAILAGSDVFGSGHAAWSAVDGEVLYLRSRNQIIDASRDQSRVLQRRHDGAEHALVIAPLGNAHDAIWEREGRYNLADLDAAGERVVHVEQRVNEAGELQWYDLSIADVDSGQVLHSQNIADSSVAWWAPYGPDYLAMSDDGKHAALGLVNERWDAPVRPRVLLISERTDGWETTTIDVPFTSGDNRGYNGQISTVAFTPDSSELVIVSATGQVLLADTANGAVRQGEARGAFAANWDTYLPPLPSSPVRWTRDGRVKMSVATDGALEVTRGETVLKRVVAADDSDAEQHGWNLENSNPVVAVAVGPAGDTFAVAFRKGLGVWGCAGSEVTGSTGMRGVTATATRSAESPHVIDLDVMVDGVPGVVHGYTVFEDGDLRAQLAWDGPLTIHSATTGPVEVVVEVRDAFGAVRSEPVRVVER